MRLTSFSLLVFLLLGNTSFRISDGSDSGKDWGEWTQTDCFKKLDFRVRRFKKLSSGSYEWQVQFRNGYSQKATFNYQIVPYADRERVKKEGAELNRIDVDSNTTESKNHYTYLKEADRVYVYVHLLRFGKDGVGPYAPCDR